MFMKLQTVFVNVELIFAVPVLGARFFLKCIFMYCIYPIVKAQLLWLYCQHMPNCLWLKEKTYALKKQSLLI